MKRRCGKNRGVYIIMFSIFIILLITLVSAGWFEELKARITGKATQNINLTINVGGPVITSVFNNSITDLSSSGPNEAPAFTSVIINFTAYSVSGAGNLNHSTALVNFTRTNEETRQNTSCAMYQSSVNYANYTCNVTMWWWDGAGAWTITAFIKDNQTNSATNSSTTFTMGQRTAFAMGPSALTWPGIAPGATNQTSNNDPLLLNNTGNKNISAGSIEINSSNLRGETNSTQALWAGNFSVAPFTGGTPPTECNITASTMNRSAYTNITLALLPRGNFTKNYQNETSGQEQLHFCLKIAGSELSTQAYSTANETEWPWVAKIS